MTDGFSLTVELAPSIGNSDRVPMSQLDVCGLNDEMQMPVVCV